MLIDTHSHLFVEEFTEDLYSQIEYLDKMRDIQPGGLHIHLMLTAGTRLIVVTLCIINLRSLEPM